MMKIQAIDWESIEDDDSMEIMRENTNWGIKCPSCGAAWLTDHDGEYELAYETDCPHLKFIIMQDDVDVEEFRFFNGYTKSQLMTSIESAARQLSFDLNGLSLKEYFSGITFNDAMKKLGHESFTNLGEEERLRVFELKKGSEHFNKDLWSLVIDAEVNTILDHTECGTACGPSSHTTFYGVKL
jgi:hypothetical protein